MNSDEYWSYMNRMRDTRSRNKKQAIIAEMLTEHDTTEAYWGLRFLVGNPLESWEGDIGVGKKTVRKAAAMAFNTNYDSIRNREKDLGNLSEVFKHLDRPTSLTGSRETLSLSEVGEKVKEVSESSGNAMISNMAEVMGDMENPEMFSYALLNDISLGASVKTIMKVLVSEYDVTRGELDRAHGIKPDISRLYFDLENGEDIPTEVSPFDRIKPQLASSKSPPDNTEGWMAQTKYDGSRILIHKDRTEIRAFTRNRNEVTANLPELEEVAWPAGKFVFDAEAVAYDPDTGEPGNFQQIMERFQREHNIEEKRKEVEIRFKCFDVLYYDGHDLTREPYGKRWSRLEAVLDEHLLVDWSDDLDELFDWSLDNGHEGIIAKDMDAPYFFSRDSSWRKVKPVKEPIEVEVTGVVRGTGKYSATLGALKVSSGDGTPLGRVGTGFKDHDRNELWQMHQRDSLEGEIIEIEYEELQKKGDRYGLRFPRYSRLRPDGEADNLERIKEL